MVSVGKSRMSKSLIAQMNSRTASIIPEYLILIKTMSAVNSMI